MSNLRCPSTLTLGRGGFGQTACFRLKPRSLGTSRGLQSPQYQHSCSQQAWLVRSSSRSGGDSSSDAGSSTGGGSSSPERPHGPGRMNKLLQNVNVAGTSLFFHILASDQRLAVPHLSVPDIRWVQWDALKAAGFKACVFDKDNTLCRPFALEIDPELRGSVEACRAAFGGKMAIYSNSAGLKQYDPEGEEAAALESAFGIHCLRHSDKKPAGGCEELEAHFGCPASDVIFIGDRYLTDVVFGNRHGMLTVRVAPLTLQGEPPGVLAARRIEEFCVARWAANGVKAPPHARLPAGRALDAVREPGGPAAAAGGST